MKSNQVTEAEVIAVEPVPYTRTWHPVSHKQYIEALDNVLKEYQVDVVNKTYTLSADGLNMFGAWILGAGNSDRPWVVGIRNSMAKKFALGGCGGNSVTVCSNMMFYGDMIESHRKHTSGLTTSYLYALCRNIVQMLFNRMGSMDQWFESLQRYALPVNLYKCLVYDAMQQGALAPSQFATFEEAFKTEATSHDKTWKGTNPVDWPSLVDFHGALTRMLRGASLFQVRDKTAVLNKVVQKYREYVDKNPTVSHLKL